MPATATSQRRTRGRPTAEEAESLQERLAAIAIRHFVLFGFKAASIETIAGEAGVTRQGIYQKFGSKKAFFDAVMKQREDGFYAHVSLSPMADPADPTSVLYDYSIQIVNHLLHPERVALTRAMSAGLHRFPEMANLQRAALDRARARISAYLEAALRHAGIAREDCWEAAEDLRNLLNGATSPVVLGMTPVPAQPDSTPAWRASFAASWPGWT